MARARPGTARMSSDASAGASEPIRRGTTMQASSISGPSTADTSHPSACAP